MIHSIKSNNKNFKPVIFHNGFNVILASRNHNNENEEKRTRNGAGKTTLIEIIHFCLGAKVDSNSVFKNDNLKGWSFKLELDIDDVVYTIERFTDNPNKLYIAPYSNSSCFDCKYDKIKKQYYVSPNSFNKVMLKEFYGISTDDNFQDCIPSFRELISYTIRRNIDGYRKAFEYYPKQKASSVQICNSYFLNLSMNYAGQFQKIKERKKGIEDYKKAAKTGVIGDFSLNIGELSTEVITRQKDVDSLKKQLDKFQVHPQYEEISKEVNSLTDEIHTLTNTLVLREQLLERYEKNYEQEKPELPIEEIKQIYDEAGVLFKDSIIVPLSEVIEFHKSLVENREEYLRNEISYLHKEIFEIKSKIESLSNRRSEKMLILKTHGALAEYILIQDRYAESKQLLEDAKKRLESAEYIEDSKSRLKIENQELLLKSRQDYNERMRVREKAVSLFKSNTEYLYPESGTLTIDLKETGYSFGVEIKNARSQGVNYMKVFCYDIVLTELGHDREQYPDFLIHDSTIFDGVDERQVARALMLAQQKSIDLGIQYICLLNSDMIPYQEFDDEFKLQFDNSVVLQISDDQENGGLLGIRF
ncbi:MAG: DUF2326 domain-containing protein [Ruminococcus sp.]|uniref:DUF2326 domain-containing protein n=1 Tax=Ruminococcus sp. TaxID=41978 RepID=UPI0025DF9B06|nr:DUF2326 domain-containing protein [Ruminococcus sp.]MBR6995769.1 DUF2326 domain-containing protein [Ruminococcus sp.]